MVREFCETLKVYIRYYIVGVKKDPGVKGPYSGPIVSTCDCAFSTCMTDLKILLKNWTLL